MHLTAFSSLSKLPKCSILFSLSVLEIEDYCHWFDALTSERYIYMLNILHLGIKCKALLMRLIP
jgi:hypothetical protein